MIDRSTDFFFTCYTVLTRPNKVETAVRGCYSWFHFRLYHVVYIVSALHHCFLSVAWSFLQKIKLLIINKDSSVGAFCRCLVENLFRYVFSWNLAKLVIFVHTVLTLLLTKVSVSQFYLLLTNSSFTFCCSESQSRRRIIVLV